MSDKEKMVANPSSSANTITPAPDSLHFSEALSLQSSMEPPQGLTHHTGILHGPVAILWDIENCPVPSDVRPEDVAGNIRMALRVHPIIKGAVTMFSAIGDFNIFPRRLREGCQRTGVKLVDVPNGRKDAADKAILIDMFLFALDNRPPSSILLISGDVDFAPALHILGQRGYTIILVIPAGVGVSSALTNAGRFVWDWPSVARGEGLVPPKASVPRGYDLSGHFMSCNIGDNNLDSLNEEEAIVYKGVSHGEHGYQANISQLYSYNSSNVSREFPSSSEYSSGNLTAGPFFSSSRCQNQPSGLSEGPTQEQTWCVQPRDLQNLKGQISRLLEMFGGSMPLVRVPSEYQKLYGRPLYMSEYGVYKLVSLIKKMSGAFVVAGKGPKKLLCLRNPGDRNIKKCPSTPILLRRDDKGKGIPVENMDGFDDDSSDEEKAACDLDDHLDGFRLELQELLVCYSRPIPLGSFVVLYEQRYKKSLDYPSFGVDGLEELFEKVREVVELHEDQGSKRKFLVSSCVSG